MGFFKSDITLDCTENAKKFSISDIQHVFSTLESLVLLTQYIPIDILVRTESLSAQGASVLNPSRALLSLKVRKCQFYSSAVISLFCAFRFLDGMGHLHNYCDVLSNEINSKMKSNVKNIISEIVYRSVTLLVRATTMNL